MDTDGLLVIAKDMSHIMESHSLTYAERVMLLGLVTATTITDATVGFIDEREKCKNNSDSSTST